MNLIRNSQCAMENSFSIPFQTFFASTPLLTSLLSSLLIILI